MGDLVDNGEDSSQWNAWFDAVEPLATRMPLVALMGNHDTYDLNWKIRKPLAYLELFDQPMNGDDQYTDQYFSFDYGNVHFVVLDTQFQEEKENNYEPNLLFDEISWLEYDLEHSHAKWKVVLMHKDPLQYANIKNPDITPGFNNIGKAFMPIFDKFHVDAVLSAHYYTYRRHGHIKNFEKNIDGPLYIITGVAGDVRYPNLWIPNPIDDFVAPQPETDNYLVMDKQGNTITIKAFNPDGTVMDESVLQK